MDKFHFTKWEKIFLVLAFLVILMLFVSSSMTYQQQELHEGVMNKRFGWLENIVAGWNFTYGGRVHNVQVDGRAGLAQFVLRKMAHFGSYFLLGGFGYLGMRRIFKIKWVAPILTWFITIALAAFDEYHQFLTGDRTPSVHDVMLDGLGALCAILLVMLVLFIRNKYLAKKKQFKYLTPLNL